jgi:hypothetical protein
MATIYPFSNQTKERLQAIPEQGKTHKWLSQIAGGLRHVFNSERSFSFLRRCCDEFVTHRPVTDTEILDAVELAYGASTRPTLNFGRGPFDWPDSNHDRIAEALDKTTPLFDADEGTDLTSRDVLQHLFRPGELVCTGQSTEQAVVRPVDGVLGDAAVQQFIVVNPMRGFEAPNRRGILSPRCQNNVALRRHLVAEFDDPNLRKPQQALLIARLGTLAPLVLVVNSGGKSLHGWFQVDRLCAIGQFRFFYYACLLGADPTRWDICGWLRMPGGLRQVEGVPSVRQRIVFFNQKVSYV